MIVLSLSGLALGLALTGALVGLDSLSNAKVTLLSTKSLTLGLSSMGLVLGLASTLALTGAFA